MSDQELISPVTLDGFVLQPTQTAPLFNNLNMKSTASSAEPGTLTAGDIGPAVDVTISRAAQFYSELQMLQSQNPGQYQQVLTGIVSILNAAIPRATRTEKQLLTQLASKFQQAAKGNLAVLQPSPPPVNTDFLTQPVPPTSTLDSLVTPQEQSIDPALLALQAQETPESALLALPAQDVLTAQSLLEPQQTLPATFGDLFLPQGSTPVNWHGVVAAYGPQGQLLTQAFPTEETAAFQPSFSASTQQALNRIFDTLHSALFGVSAVTGTGSAGNSG